MRTWGIALLALLLVAGTEEQWLGLRSGAGAAEVAKDYEKALRLWKASLVAAGEHRVRLRTSEAGIGRMALSMVENHRDLLTAAVALQTRAAKDPKLRDNGLILGLRWQAGALTRLSRFEEAEAVYRRLLTEAKSRKREKDVATAHAGLAYVLRLRGELTEAETHCRAALRILSKRYGADHWKVAGGWIGLGRIRLVQKRYDEAEDYVRKGLAIREKEERRNPRKFIEALATLAEIVEARGRKEEAEQIRNRIRELEKRQDEAG